MVDEADTTVDRKREARLRREAARMGLALRKSRTRDPDRLDFGLYHIVNVESDYVVAGRFPYGYSLDLDAVEQILDELEAGREEEAFRVQMAAMRERKESPGSKQAG